MSVATEFSYIQDWANDYSMIINLAKSKEIIFYNAKAIPISIPDPIYMALNEYHRSLMSIFREISAVICILNTL